MKPIFCLILFCTTLSHAHDHVNVGLDPGNPQRLYLLGPRDQEQESLYVPRGEPFSYWMPQFPGGWFASELTFTTGLAADPWIEIVSVTGPAGGSFSFWDVDASSSTWTRPAGWTQTVTDRPSFSVIWNGDNHAHGRAFTMDRPGTYSATFRAVDPGGLLEASQEKVITFQALPPPRLSIRIENGQAVVSFLSRLKLLYDLQISTDLTSGTWDSVGPDYIAGDGTVIETTLPLSHPRAFFRLIEFK